MPKPKQQPKPGSFWRKLALQTAIIAAVLAAVIIGGYFGYKKWQISNLTTQAREHLAKSDPRSAFLAARRAVDLNPSSLEATRLAADALNRADVPEAVGWFGRVSELSPGSLDDALAWARCAIKFGDFSSAQNALKRVPESARDTATYHQLAGGVAVGLGHPDKAGTFYARAAALDPASELHQFNHAQWIIEFDRDPARRKAAAETMQKLAASSAHSLHARRSLVAVHTADGAFEKALAESSKVVAEESANTADRVAHLNLLAKLNDPGLDAFLAASQAAATDPLAALAVIHWMNTHDRSAAAVEWAATLTEKITSDTNVATGIADCHDTLQSWDKLLALTKTGDWKDKEALRFAFLSRAQRGLGDGIGAGNNWTAASSAALQSQSILNAVILRTTAWGWREETRQLLWAATDTSSARWALSALHKLYKADADTAGLLRVTNKATDIDPTDDEARNNFAALCLLMNQNVPQATDIAKQLAAKYPENPVIISTLAFALHKGGRTAEGLAAFEKLKPEQLKHPAIAPYYGILLAAAGKAEAKEFLAIAEKTPLLPQEQTLIREVKEKLPQ